MHFEKVSLKEFVKASNKCLGMTDEEELEKLYNDIQLPTRSTKRSAGYDFKSPFNISVGSEYTVIPSGIRWVVGESDPMCFLAMFPRSGQGFKNGFRLRNTTGIIDSDYCLSENEGHIMLKVQTEKPLNISAGQGFVQGIIIPFLTVSDEETVTASRNGGFGSTDATSH